MKSGGIEGLERLLTILLEKFKMICQHSDFDEMGLRSPFGFASLIWELWTWGIEEGLRAGDGIT